MGDRHMNIYEISCKTLALIPIGPKKTHILEEEKEFDVDNHIMKIIDYNCKINGSSYLGRYDSSKLLIGKSSKLPIILEESRKQLYFPTTSPKNKECCWISYNNLKSYEKNNENSILIFKNNKKLEINTSSKIIEKQLIKTLKLNLILNSKKAQ